MHELGHVLVDMGFEGSQINNDEGNALLSAENRAKIVENCLKP
jgi:hypothetical protein